MNILFIDPTGSVINYGMRCLAGYIKENGYDVKMVFLKQESIDNNKDYSEKVYSQLAPIIDEADVICFSFMSNYFGQARFLTEFIKANYSKIIIWGGIHAMASPDKCLSYADIICLGEGEEALLSLLDKIKNGKDYSSAQNFWFKEDNRIIKNQVQRLVEDLDKYPFPLYDMGNEYYYHEGNVVRASSGLLQAFLHVEKSFYGFEAYPYMTMASRGCPHACTYCCNNLFRNLYRRNGKLFRSISNVKIIEEIESFVRRFPWANVIEFFDDDFIISRRDMDEFTSLYKERVNLPFRCNISPNNASQDVIDQLADAGMAVVEMGLQTASKRINKEIYKRRIENDEIVAAAKMINKHKHIKPYYDVILDNPYENYSDISQTLRFLARLPSPMFMTTFSLTFFPGSELYKKAVSDGIICDDETQIYNKANKKIYNEVQPYVKFLIFLIRLGKRRGFLTLMIFNLISSENCLRILDSRYLNWIWSFLLKVKVRLGKE